MLSFRYKFFQQLLLSNLYFYEIVSHANLGSKTLNSNQLDWQKPTIVRWLKANAWTTHASQPWVAFTQSNLFDFLELQV